MKYSLIIEDSITTVEANSLGEALTKLEPTGFAPDILLDNLVCEKCNPRITLKECKHE